MIARTSTGGALALAIALSVVAAPTPAMAKVTYLTCVPVSGGPSMMVVIDFDAATVVMNDSVNRGAEITSSAVQWGREPYVVSLERSTLILTITNTEVRQQCYVAPVPQNKI